MTTVNNSQDEVETEEGTVQAVKEPAPTEDALCDRCTRLFGDPSLPNYGCTCHRGGMHYQLDAFWRDPPTWTCPGCRLVGTLVTNMRAMIRRNDHGISPSVDATGVTAERQHLEEMVTMSTEKNLKIEFRPAARVVDVRVDVLPGMAGTIIKIADDNVCPHNETIRGLHIPPKIDIARTKRWLTTCRDGHAGCRRQPVSASTPVDDNNTASIRLIDVHTMQIVPVTLDAEFVALSYVWGTNTQPLLTSKTLEGYSTPGGLDASKLPTTIAHAIRLTGELGLHFLWVDSLCIIQDDDADKQRQLPRMAALYEAAELVFVAAAGRDANAGLAGYQTDRVSSQATETVLGDRYTTIQGGLYDVLRWTHWDRRGWTYQEAFQARRAVVFTDALIYWSCRDTVWREDLDCDHGGRRLRRNGGTLWRYTPDGQRTLGCTPNNYFVSVEHFCRRTLRDGSDALWAYWGVLSHQAARHPPIGYIWALPYGCLSASLVWRKGHFCLSEHSRRATAAHSIALAGGGALRVPFPSWSWLSTDTAVEFLDTCGASIVNSVRWHVPITLWNPATTQFYLGYLRQIGVEGVDEARQLFVKQNGRLRPAPTSGRAFAMDYGLLCFIAETAQLTLSRTYVHTGDDECPCRLMPDGGKEATHTHVTVRSGDQDIGGVIVPLSVFKDDATDVPIDVVLLSSNASPRRATDDRCKVQPATGCNEVQHVPGCQHLQSHNLMVVTWLDDVAYLQSMFAVDKAVWEGIPPDKKGQKQIILG